MKLTESMLQRKAWISLVVTILAACLWGWIFNGSLGKYGELKNEVLVLLILLLIPIILYRHKIKLVLWGIYLFSPVLGLDFPPREYGLSIFDALLILLLGLHFVQAPETGANPIKYRPLRTPLLLLLLSSTISSILSPDKVLAFYDLYLSLKYAIFYCLFVKYIDTMDDLRTICALVIFGFAGCIVFGLLQNYAGLEFKLVEYHNSGNGAFQDIGELFTRVSGPFPNSTELGQFLLIPLFLALGLVIDGKSWWLKSLMGILFLAGTWVLLLTLSRCPIISFAIVLVLVVVYRSRPVMLFSLIPLAVAGYYLMDSLQLSNFFLDHLLPGGLGARVGSGAFDFFDNRLPQWSAAIDIFLHHPLFGVGFANLKDILPLYVPGIVYEDFYQGIVGLSSWEICLGHLGHVHVDSTWFTWLPEMGAVGFGILVYIIGSTLKNLFTLSRKSRDPNISAMAFAFGAGFLAVLFNLIANYAYSDQGCGVMMWTCLAVSTVLGRMNANLDNSEAPFPGSPGALKPSPSPAFSQV